MNNATYFGTAERLREAYDLRMSLSGGYHKGYDYWIGSTLCYPEAPKGPFHYATHEADTAFAYRVGEIVKSGGRYDVVTGYKFSPGDGRGIGAFKTIVLKHAGWLGVGCGDANEFKADIPPDVLEIIRGQLQQNCPLKTAGCK